MPYSQQYVNNLLDGSPDYVDPNTGEVTGYFSGYNVADIVSPPSSPFYAFAAETGYGGGDTSLSSLSNAGYGGGGTGYGGAGYDYGITLQRK
jgi:hypothetical protein